MSSQSASFVVTWQAQPPRSRRWHTLNSHGVLLQIIARMVQSLETAARSLAGPASRKLPRPPRGLRHKAVSAISGVQRPHLHHRQQRNRQTPPHSVHTAPLQRRSPPHSQHWRCRSLGSLSLKRHLCLVTSALSLVPCASNNLRKHLRVSRCPNHLRRVHLALCSAACL